MAQKNPAARAAVSGVASTVSSVGRSRTSRQSKFTYGVSGLPAEVFRSPATWRKGRKLPKVLNAYGNKQWHTAQDNLKYLLTEEYDDPTSFYVKKKQIQGRDWDPRHVIYEKNMEKERKPIRTNQAALDLCTTRYLKYCCAVRELDEVEKLLVHPQKRALVKQCIEGAIIRMLEYKNEMIKLDLREFQFFDHTLAEMRLTPDDVEMVLPHHFITSRYAVLNTRRTMLEAILARLHPPPSETEFVKRKYIQWMPTAEAVLTIQKNQRGFAGRVKFETVRLHSIDLRVKGKHAGSSSDVHQKTIMRYRVVKWINYTRRIKRERAMEKEDINIGMLHDNKKNRDAMSKRYDDHVARNMILAEENDDVYEQEKIMQEVKIIDKEGPEIANRLRQNILQWALELRDLTGTVPEFPEEEEGGSALLFSKKTIKEVESDLAELADKKKEKKKNDKKPEKKKEKKPDNKKGKRPIDQEYAWLMPVSQALPMLEDTEHEYCENWVNKDDNPNLKQRHDQELLKENLRVNVEETLRREVDELMRQELKRLAMAVDKQRQKEPKPKKKKDSKTKKGKKKPKDLTADSTMEELYEQLVQDEIIVAHQPVHFTDFLGDHYFCSTAVEESGKEALPSLSLVKRIMMQLAVIPLSSATVHERSPLVRSILIAGTRSSGKKMLLNAVVHESGANLFNMTPANLEGKLRYEGKKGMQLLMHTVLKVGKAMEPSIFWVDNCEKMFLKKKDKADEVKPHKWAPYYLKALKASKPGDRMIWIGTTSVPFLAKQAIFKMFQRVILVPRPDYNSRYLIWSHFIYAKLGRAFAKDIDVSSLTKVTNGFTTGDILNAVNETLTETRLNRMRKGRLTASEFITRISTFDPIYIAEEAMMHEWFLKSPMMKKRVIRRYEGVAI